MADDIAIKVEHVSKEFKLPHEKQTSVKGALINLVHTGKKNRSYERQQALKDVSFEIKEGEFFGIVGRNGSGKSTLLKMLAGIYMPTEGHIQVNGKLTPFIELGVGFSPELTGRENIFLNGALLGFNRSEMLAMYDDIVDFAELEKFMDQKLKNYSSGMQVRLAFSIAIRAQSDILLLDEVLAVGDAAFQQKCFDYFEELKLQKKTVVFVSHDMSTVRRFCSHAVYIKDSKLIHDGTPEEVADIYLEENLRDAQMKSSDTETNDTGKTHSLKTKIISQTKDIVTLGIDYSTTEIDEMYVGISVTKDGLSIAEINSLNEKPLLGKGTITYKISTSPLNAGVYGVAAALFKKNNMELLAFTKNKSDFAIKGNDPTRGGALRLTDTWQAENKGSEA